MNQDDFVRRAIGVPFRQMGRDYDGWDCWGLVIRAYSDVLGVKIPDFDYNAVSNYKLLARHFTTRATGFWDKTDKHDMAVACIYRRGLVIHAGVVIGNKILHVEEGIETCLERISRFRIEGFYAPSNAAPSVPE